MWDGSGFICSVPLWFAPFFFVAALPPSYFWSVRRSTLICSMVGLVSVSGFCLKQFSYFALLFWRVSMVGLFIPLTYLHERIFSVYLQVKTTSPTKYFINPNTSIIQPSDSCSLLLGASLCGSVMVRHFVIFCSFWSWFEMCSGRIWGRPSGGWTFSFPCFLKIMKWHLLCIIGMTEYYPVDRR